MNFGLKKDETEQGTYALDGFQRLALGGMLILAIFTFIGANLHAMLWQSSQWLVSTVLPAVVVQLTNSERADLGEVSLSRNATLDEAARQKAQHMANNEYFAHYAPDGTSPWYWFDKAGYSYAHAGENLAIHFTDSSEVVEAWMDSPTHRANIVSGKYTEIGVGTAKGTYEGYDTVYVVQLFGTPAQAPVVKTAPVVANNPPVAPAPIPAPALAADEEAVLAVTEDIERQEVTGLEVADTSEVTGTASSTESTIVITPATSEDISPEDVVVIEKEIVSTSSGLAVANLVQTPAEYEANLVGVVTKPNTVLQIVYTLFGFIVIGLLLASVVVEAKKNHKVQMVYGLGLLIIMAGLWYVHFLLTGGAMVV